ncbi:hypothetical protein M2138_000282 [Dysgonomonadaceae bacterium PH5-43]|nr:hypothetical protein [Dysgonomonadaceae bacterium PH5-43]
MVKRFAAHYTCSPYDKLYKLHYIEIDESNRLVSVSPLNQETHSTSFFNGVIILLKEYIQPRALLNLLKDKAAVNPDATVEELLNMNEFGSVSSGDEVNIYILDGIDLLSAKLGSGQPVISRILLLPDKIS